MAAYKRVIIKISGEALGGDNGFGLNPDIIGRIADDIIAVKNAGVQVGIVVGGGNFWRGGTAKFMSDRATADHMGMLATVMNALALQDAFEKKGADTRVMTALTITRVAEPYIQRKAITHLNKGRIVIFACGTGNPYFTTDTAAVLRAAEIGAGAILLAKNVDGVYDSDPKKNPDAKKYDSLNYLDLLSNHLGVMDYTAASLCMDNKIPLIVFGLKEEGGIMKAVNGEKIGTLIH